MYVEHHRTIYSTAVTTKGSIKIYFFDVQVLIKHSNLKQHNNLAKYFINHILKVTF